VNRDLATRPRGQGEESLEKRYREAKKGKLGVMCAASRRRNTSPDRQEQGNEKNTFPVIKVALEEGECLRLEGRVF